MIELIIIACGQFQPAPMDCVQVHYRKANIEACAEKARELYDKAPLKLSEHSNRAVIAAYCKGPEGGFDLEEWLLKNGITEGTEGRKM